MSKSDESAPYTEPMDMPLVLITRESLSLDELISQVSGLTGNYGAVASFSGIVRNVNLGRTVLFLEYEAYKSLAEQTFERIRNEAHTAWPKVKIGIHHRIGRLELGETSVVIAAASPHRTDAFTACRYTIERVKQIAPIWKREHFEGGHIWLENSTVDPDDEEARSSAYRIACT